MERFLYKSTRFVMLCCVLSVFISCREKIQTPQDEPTPQTLIVYMVGTDLSWAYDYNEEGIVKALSKDIKGQSRVIIVRHSDKKTLKAIELEYKNGTIEEKEFASYNLPIEMDKSSLSYIFSDITSRAPATSYGLIIGSHGWGWIPFADFECQIKYNGMKKSAMKHLDIELPREFITRFLGENSTPSNIIEIPTLAEAIGATGKKFEYILFDACFMANVEALYDLRNSSKYIVASLCEIMGKGFPYEKMIPYLLQNKGKSYDLTQAAKSFYEYYKQVSQSGGVYTGSIAVVDCSQFDALANAMRKVNQAIEDLAEPNKLQTYDGGTNHLFFDLGDYVNQACKDQTNKQAFEQQLRNTVVTKYTLDKFWSSYINANFYPVNTEVFSGLTTSAPSKLCRESYPQTAWYKATH